MVDWLRDINRVRNVIYFNWNFIKKQFKLLISYDHKINSSILFDFPSDGTYLCGQNLLFWKRGMFSYDPEQWITVVSQRLSGQTYRPN